MTRYLFLVIVSVPDPEGPRAWENLALQIPTHVQSAMTPEKATRTEDAGLTPEVAALFLSFRGPVFHLGEILVVDLDGRELAGRGRKPSKWGVGFEEFATVEEAIERSAEVSRG